MEPVGRQREATTSMGQDWKLNESVYTSSACEAPSPDYVPLPTYSPPRVRRNTRELGRPTPPLLGTSSIGHQQCQGLGEVGPPTPRLSYLVQDERQ